MQIKDLNHLRESTLMKQICQTMNCIGQEALLMSTDGASLTTMPGGWYHCSLHKQSSSHATSDLINQSALSHPAEESLPLKKTIQTL